METIQTNLDKLIMHYDLSSSGPLIQALFEYAYPKGLTLREMLANEHGWVVRAAEMYIRTEEDPNVG